MRLFQSPRSVADLLQEQALSEREKLNFLWIIVGINSLFGQASYFQVFFLIFQSPLLALVQLAPLGIMIWGIMASFQANLRGDNRQFLERFICLSAALSIRAYLVYVLLVFVARAIPSLIYWSPGSTLSFFIINLAPIGVTLYIYLRMRSLMAYVATGRE